MNRLVAGLALLGVVAVAVAACGEASNDGAGLTGLDLASCGDMTYGGEGSPDALIVSDLPLQGDSRGRSEQMNDAVTQVLDDAGWKAGATRVAFQACDDSLAETGLWDEATCRENATAYAGDESVLGVIGTYNSGCAQAMIPILNQAENGAVAMVSPGNTAICLTQSADICPDGQPDSLYPTGERNYARVVPNDAAQGAALALWADVNGLKRAAVLQAAEDDTSAGQATSFVNAARSTGIKVVLREDWDPEAGNYRKLMQQVGRADPDVILLAGLTEQNGGRLIRDKVAVVGPNGDGGPGLFAPDGFAQQSTIDEAGPASKGMFVTVPGRAPGLLGQAGRQFTRELSLKLDGQPVEIYAPYAGQAAQVMLDAIEAAGGERTEVASSLYGISIKDGITGDFEITDSGDPSTNPVTVFEAKKTFRPFESLEIDPMMTRAARGED